MKVVACTPGWHDQVLAFREQVYPDNRWGNTREHFRWRFVDHPYDGDLIYLLAVEGDTILGQWAGLRDRVWAGGEAVDCNWMVDLVVAEEHRDTMAAMALFRAAMREGPLLAIGAPEEMVGFYQTFRWRRLAVADTFYSIFRPGPLVALSGRHPDAWQEALLHVADAAAPWVQRAAARTEGVEPVSFEGAEALFEEVRDGLVISERTASTLDWKFTRRPCGEHQVFGLRHPDGRLRAYAVLKLRHRPGVARWAELADFLVHPSDGEAFSALVTWGRHQALAAGVDFVRLRCSLPEHTTLLRSPWWVRRVRAPLDDLFVYGDDGRLCRHPWYFTAFCSDSVDTGADEWD